MNMGLFAADEVGYEIAKYMKENGVQLACLVLDSKDPKSLNKKTIANSKTKNSFTVMRYTNVAH